MLCQRKILGQSQHLEFKHARTYSLSLSLSHTHTHILNFWSSYGIVNFSRFFFTGYCSLLHPQNGEEWVWKPRALFKVFVFLYRNIVASTQEVYYTLFCLIPETFYFEPFIYPINPASLCIYAAKFTSTTCHPLDHPTALCPEWMI
jgi:hypothetical protein